MILAVNGHAHTQTSFTLSQAGSAHLYRQTTHLRPGPEAQLSALHRPAKPGALLQCFEPPLRRPKSPAWIGKNWEKSMRSTHSARGSLNPRNGGALWLRRPHHRNGRRHLGARCSPRPCVPDPRSTSIRDGIPPMAATSTYAWNEKGPTKFWRNRSRLNRRRASSRWILPTSTIAWLRGMATFFEGGAEPVELR